MLKNNIKFSTITIPHDAMWVDIHVSACVYNYLDRWELWTEYSADGNPHPKGGEGMVTSPALLDPLDAIKRLDSYPRLRSKFHHGMLWSGFMSGLQVPWAEFLPPLQKSTHSESIQTPVFKILRGVWRIETFPCGLCNAELCGWYHNPVDWELLWPAQTSEREERHSLHCEQGTASRG